MRKLLFLTLAAMTLGITAFAENSAPIMLITGQSDVMEIKVASITKITFEGTKMLIDKADGNIEMDITDVTNIVFDGEVTSEESIEANYADDFTVKFDHGVMSLSVAPGKTANVTLYNASGQCFATAPNVMGEWSMSLTNLQPGVYIIRVNNKTFKFSR